MSRLEILTSHFDLVSAGEAVSVSGGERLGLISVSSFYVSCPSLSVGMYVEKSVIHECFMDEQLW